MPTFRVTDPTSGKTLRLTGDSPPTEQELEQIFAAQQPEDKSFLEEAGEAVASVVEPLATIASGIVAEPIAGLAGIAQAVNPFAEEGAGARAVEATREALTFQPRTEAGQAGLQAVGETLAPVGEAISGAEKALGDAAFELTGSPALAAAATTLPAATMEALGFGIGRRVAKVKTGLKKAPGKIPSPAKPSEKQVTKALLESAPEVEQIKNASRAIYKEIDELNVVAKPSATRSLVDRVVNTANKQRVNKVLTPKSAEAVRIFKEELKSKQPKTLSDFDDLRKTAQIAASSLDPADARIGIAMIDEIDEFLDALPSGAFKGPDAKTVGSIGARYKSARKLWGRARRAEIISEAFSKADLQASGFENGIRTQLRSILNNKKRSRFFTKDELSSMRDVVKGDVSTNTLKLIGRLGFSEGAATNILGGLGGLAVLGPAAPVVGQISRKIAQVATQKAANQVDNLIRSGADGRKIAKAYLSVVPKAKRNVSDLSDLLLSSGKEVDDLLDSADKIIKEAAEITKARKLFERVELAGTVAATAPQTMKEAEQ